jgi:hypothetical protein
MAVFDLDASETLIRHRLEAICSQLVNQQSRLSFAERDWNDCAPDLPASMEIRRFIRSYWNARLGKPLAEIVNCQAQTRWAEQLDQTIEFKSAELGGKFLK